MKKKKISKRQLKRMQKKANMTSKGEVRTPPSVHGRVSAQIGLITLAGLIILIGVSYLTHGGSAAIIGAFGLIVLMLSIVGVFQGVLGMGEANRSQGPSKRGLVLNIIVLLVLLMIFFNGLRSV